MSVDWTIEIENSAGAWEYDGLIQRPNDDIETEYMSTQQKIRLANGSNAFITPETRRLKEPVSMFFAQTSSSFRSQIETYMLNGDKVRITTHTGEVYIGRFISMKRVWFSGISPDEFDINLVLERTE